jgi:hypothetical protein
VGGVVGGALCPALPLTQLIFLRTERAVLERRARCCSAPHRQVVRAIIVLHAADGWANVDIAYELGTHVDVVS